MNDADLAKYNEAMDNAEFWLSKLERKRFYDTSWAALAAQAHIAFARELREANSKVK